MWSARHSWSALSLLVQHPFAFGPPPPAGTLALSTISMYTHIIGYSVLSQASVPLSLATPPRMCLLATPSSTYFLFIPQTSLKWSPIWRVPWLQSTVHPQIKLDVLLWQSRPLICHLSCFFVISYLYVDFCLYLTPLLEGKALTYFCFLVHRVEPDTVGIHKCLLNFWIK